MGRENAGTCAARTARAAHEPAGVDASGAPTLAVVTRPDDAKVIVMGTEPWVPRLEAQSRTAPRTLFIALSTSLREGLSAPPAGDGRGAGAPVLAAALPPAPQRKMQGISPAQPRTHGLTVGAAGAVFVGCAAGCCGAVALVLAVDRALRGERSERPLDSVRRPAVEGVGASVVGVGVVTVVVVGGGSALLLVVALLPLASL